MLALLQRATFAKIFRALCRRGIAVQDRASGSMIYRHPPPRYQVYQIRASQFTPQSMSGDTRLSPRLPKESKDSAY